MGPCGFSPLTRRSRDILLARAFTCWRGEGLTQGELQHSGPHFDHGGAYNTVHVFVCVHVSLCAHVCGSVCSPNLAEGLPHLSE